MKPNSQGNPGDALNRLPSDPVTLPDRFSSEEALDDFLTQPRPHLVEFIRTLTSPLVVLGAGGKMGPTLAVLARRAAEAAGHPLRVIAVSRFSDASSRRWLESRGVSTVSADLLERGDVFKLPDAAHVIYLVGLKFGTAENPSLTWAANTVVPLQIAERYAGSQMVALSTGNVYPLVPVRSGGAREDQSLTPLGEYGNAAVARERLFEYMSRKLGVRVAILRLNYAVELRYGVLVDIAQKVFAGEAVDLASGYFNCIWQGDANEMILRSLPLASTPPRALNFTGLQILSVREVATHFGKLFNRPVRWIGTEADNALLSNADTMCRELGTPPTSVQDMIRWIARWVEQGGRNLKKPTHFEVRDGKY